MNKLFTVLGGKFKFSAQDSDLEYLCWRRKIFPVSSDLKPPLGVKGQNQKDGVLSLRRGKGKNVKKESRSLSDFSGTDFGVSRGQCTLEDLENIHTVKCYIDPTREIPTFTIFKTRASSLYRVAKKVPRHGKTCSYWNRGSSLNGTKLILDNQ